MHDDVFESIRAIYADRRATQSKESANRRAQDLKHREKLEADELEARKSTDAFAMSEETFDNEFERRFRVNPRVWRLSP